MQDIPIVQSAKLLAYPDLICAVSTKLGGISPDPYGLNMSFHVGDDHENVLVNRQRFFKKLNIDLDHLAIPRQCHTNTVRNAPRPGSYERCDALVTNQRRVFLTVTVADCIPLFLYDPRTSVVAVIHVGWRGAASGIIPATLKLLGDEFSTNPKDLVAFLGPSARVCCYEVGQDVARRFSTEFLRPRSHGKHCLDLVSFSRYQLIRGGVAIDQVEVDGRCTICRPELFHSYRRNGEKSGRMMGVIGLS